MAIRRSVGANLRQWRMTVGANVSQAAIAARLGTVQTSLSTYESGARTMQYDVLLALYKAGANLNYIISGEGQPSRSGDPSQYLELALKDAVEEGVQLLVRSGKTPDVGKLSRSALQSIHGLLAFYAMPAADRATTIKAHDECLNPLRECFQEGGLT